MSYLQLMHFVITNHVTHLNLARKVIVSNHGTSQRIKFPSALSYQDQKIYVLSVLTA